MAKPAEGKASYQVQFEEDVHQLECSGELGQLADGTDVSENEVAGNLE